MPQEPNSNLTNQQAETIVNVVSNAGGINVQNATIITNVPADTKPTSRVLTRKLIEAIRDFSPRANIFLGKITEADRPNWEMRADNKYLSTAKDTIVSSYASVLGVFLSNLFGCENTDDYRALGITIAKRSLQIINFTFISALQRHLKNGNNPLSEPPAPILQTFFETQNELDISQYAELLSALVTIFKNQKIEFPISEIRDREEDFKKGSAFFETCMNLNSLATNSGSNLPAANEIEAMLTGFLVPLNFLAAYKMISIKDISYEEVWYKDDTRGRGYKNQPQYLYCYTFLGISKNAGQKYNYSDKPLNTEAVLLFKNNYREGVSLFPFVIDYYTIIDEPQVSICFFTSYEDEVDDNIGNLRKIIRFFESGKTASGAADGDIIIRFDEDIENALMGTSNQDIITVFKTEDNSNKFKAKKKNEVFKAFEEVKTTILGEQE